MNKINDSNPSKVEEKKKIDIIHQGKKVSDFWSNSIFSGVTYSYMQPLFDYLGADKDNQLSIEQFGDLHEN
jgi:hypothetical protein